MPRCALLGIVARLDERLSVVREALPQVMNTPEVRFDCDDTRKFAVVEEVARTPARRGRQGVGRSTACG